MRTENESFIEAHQLDDFYMSPEVEVLRDRIAVLERHNRELRKLNNRSIWRVIKDKMIESLRR